MAVKYINGYPFLQCDLCEAIGVDTNDEYQEKILKDNIDIPERKIRKVSEFSTLELTYVSDDKTRQQLTLCSKCGETFYRLISNARNLIYHHYHQTGEKIPISNEIKTILEENKNVKSSND